MEIKFSMKSTLDFRTHRVVLGCKKLLVQALNEQLSNSCSIYTHVAENGGEKGKLSETLAKYFQPSSSSNPKLFSSTKLKFLTSILQFNLPQAQFSLEISRKNLGEFSPKS